MLADDSANPRTVAADLLAQAEHDVVRIPHNDTIPLIIHPTTARDVPSPQHRINHLVNRLVLNADWVRCRWHVLFW